MQSDEEEDGWADVGELQEIDLSQLRSHKDQNGNVDKRNFGKGGFSSPQTPRSKQTFIVLSRFCLNRLFVFVREQNQRTGQKNGKSVCRKSSEETSRGRQRPAGEDGRGAGLHGETRSGTGTPPACSRLMVTFVSSLTVHRPRRQQRLDGLLIGGQAGSVEIGSGLWTNEEEPGLTQHQRLGNLHRKKSRIRSVDGEHIWCKCGKSPCL